MTVGQDSNCPYCADQNATDLLRGTAFLDAPQTARPETAADASEQLKAALSRATGGLRADL